MTNHNPDRKQFVPSGEVANHTRGLRKLIADADRYRWLREHGDIASLYATHDAYHTGGDSLLQGDKLDQAIDSEIANGSQR